MALETSDHRQAPQRPPPLEFRAVYDSHAHAVRRFLGDLLRDDTAADEATQETFVRAHARLPSLASSDKALPWLFGIARNVFHEEVRARRRHLRAVDDEDDGAAEPDAAPSPEGLLLDAEADRHLSAALGDLPEDRRAALLLRVDHELDYDEIGNVMGWPVSKVKNEIHRARLALRTRLAQYMGGT